MHGRPARLLPSIEHKLWSRAKQSMQLTTKSACLALCAILLAGCAPFFSSIGPSRRDIEHSAEKRPLPPIQLIEVNEEVTQRLTAQRSRHLFSEV